MKFTPTSNVVIEIKKNRSKALVSLADEELKIQDLIGAERDLRLAIEDYPEYVAARNRLMTLLRQQGNLNGAKQIEDASPGGETVSPDPVSELPTTHIPVDTGPNIDPNASLRNNDSQANQLMNEGDSLYKNGQGDVDAATAKWDKALELSAGTPLHESLMKRLDQAKSHSNSGGNTGEQ